MSLKNKLQTYSPLELKEFIKEHNKRARKMVSEETKEFRKKQLEKLIIKAVGKKDDLIEKMVKASNIKDISSFKLIKEKGKMKQEDKDNLDDIQAKETEQLAQDFKKGKIDDKKLRKELNEIKNERIRAELPKLNVPKLIKFIKEKVEEKKMPKIIISEYLDKGKAPAKKTEEKSVPPLPKKQFKIKLPKEQQAKQSEKQVKQSEKKEQAKQSEPPKEDTDTEDEEFVMPKFFKNTDPKIRDNIEKAVKKGELPESSVVLVSSYKTMKKIKNAVEKKNKPNDERVDGLGRGLDADQQDEDYYKAIFGKKYPKKEIEKEFLAVAKNMIGGDKPTRDKVRKWINKADVSIQKKLFNSNKEGYLLSVSGVNDKTGESRKEADKLDQALAKQKAEREKEFAKAKAEQNKEVSAVEEKRKAILKKK